MTPLDPSHPNLHLSPGRSPRNKARRQQVLALLAETDAQTGQPLSFLQMAERLGITKERVRVLALREGVTGRQRARVAGKRVGVLRGSRRWFRKGGASKAAEGEGDNDEQQPNQSS